MRVYPTNQPTPALGRGARAQGPRAQGPRAHGPRAQGPGWQNMGGTAALIGCPGRLYFTSVWFGHGYALKFGSTKFHFQKQSVDTAALEYLVLAHQHLIGRTDPVPCLTDCHNHSNRVTLVVARSCIRNYGVSPQSVIPHFGMYSHMAVKKKNYICKSVRGQYACCRCRPFHIG